MTPQDVLKLCKQRNVQFIDLRFMDFPGLWQHTTCPISELTLDSFDHGFGFDGSSIRGWQAINESDMLLHPVADTAKIDPFLTLPTLSIICDVRRSCRRRSSSAERSVIGAYSSRRTRSEKRWISPTSTPRCERAWRPSSSPASNSGCTAS